MVDFLFWVIGSCFLFAGLFCLFIAVLTFIGWRQGMERASFPRFLVWVGGAVASEGLMWVFYTCKP